MPTEDRRFAVIDYASIEARILAHYTEGEAMNDIKLDEGSKIAEAFKTFTDHTIAATASITGFKTGMMRAKTPGKTKNKIIKTEKHNGRIWELHATKGWRSRRIR